MIRAVLETEKLPLPCYTPGDADPGAAQIDERKVYWDAEFGYSATPVYALDALKPGNLLGGPAVIQAAYTTIVVKPGHVFAIESHGLGVIGTDAGVCALLEKQMHETASD